ncbi:MAG: hypothetical protein Q9192_008204, partial [Flavoplaca navasiana]
QELQYNIHASIPTPVLSTTIADVAAGIGMWLLEVAREHPGEQCMGFDISIAQASPKQWLPSNPSFSTWNVLEEPPEGLRGRLDTVNIRLLWLLLGKKGSSTVVKNIAMLLKPGENVQWEEVDMSQSITATTDDSFKLVTIARMDQMIKARSQRSLIPKIERLLWENGFQVGK